MKLINSPQIPLSYVQLIVIAMLWVICVSQHIEAAEPRKIKAVATVGMLNDLVVNIGGEDVAVSGIMGPGVDPHLYKPNRDDVQTLMNADVIFYVGHHLEGRMGDALSRLAKNKRVIAVGERLRKTQLLTVGIGRDEASGDELRGDEIDPHLWMDVGLWTHLIEVVVTELSSLARDRADSFRSRGDAYKQSLVEVDLAIRESIASIPGKQRVLITSHDAFRYLGRAYGIDVLGIQGISTESEAGAGDIVRLVDLIVERQVPSIFVESSVAKKNIEALVEGALARGHNLRIGGELFADAMGARGTEQGTYRGMMLANGIKISRALGGDTLKLVQLCRTHTCGVRF